MQYDFQRVGTTVVLVLSSGLASATDGYFQHGYGVKAQAIAFGWKF
jgi:hypothetical protein